MREYKVEIIPTGPVFQLEKQLNRMAEAGWELIDIIKENGGYQCTFCRVKK